MKFQVLTKETKVFLLFNTENLFWIVSWVGMKKYCLQPPVTVDTTSLGMISYQIITKNY